jgi:Lrp/AsnC family leucine-responsive transcriptional regulator
MIDGTDAAILRILQENARTSNAEIGRQVGLATSAVFERIRKLEERGIVRGYTAIVDPKSLDAGLLAFILARAEERVGTQATAEALARIPEVLEVHHIAGEDCAIAKVRVKDTDALAKLLRDDFGKVKTLKSTRTTIVLSTVKESSRIPLPEDPEKPDSPEKEKGKESEVVRG